MTVRRLAIAALVATLLTGCAASAPADRVAAVSPEVRLPAADRSVPLCAGVFQTQALRRDSRPVVGGPDGLTVVVGDSYSEGWGLPNPRLSWPRAYGRKTDQTVYVNAVGGSGLVSTGLCPHTTILERLGGALRAKPTQLIIQTGLNDLDSSDADVRRALRTIAKRAHMPVVLVGPPIVPARSAAQSRHTDALFRASAKQLHWRYVSLLPLTPPLQADHGHPTTQGQQDIAAFVVGALA